MKVFDLIKLFFNIKKFKPQVEQAYVVVIKLLRVLGAIDQELNTTVLGKYLTKVLPSVIDAVDSIREFIIKYGSIVGFEPIEVANLDEVTPEELSEEVDKLVKVLSK